jgi:ABC-type amino acid transport substrate-binding protein
MRCVIVGLLGAVLAGGLASAEPAGGRLKTVQETATLRIAYRTDSRPFAFLDGKGKPTGY